jgi:hypothetical protein
MLLVDAINVELTVAPPPPKFPLLIVITGGYRYPVPLLVTAILVITPAVTVTFAVA